MFFGKVLKNILFATTAFCGYNNQLSFRQEYCITVYAIVKQQVFNQPYNSICFKVQVVLK
jgi:hypothetical protein